MRRVHRSLERAVLLLAFIAGLPARRWRSSTCLGQQEYSFEVRWTVIAVVLAVWIGSAALAFQMVTRVLFLQANLLGALREGRLLDPRHRRGARAAPLIW